MTRTIRRLTILSVLCAIGVAAPAHAGQIVYPSGNGIWVMNEDGSAKRQLVDATQVPDMEYLGNPSVQPNGTEVAFDGRWNKAFYEMNHWGSAPGMCGANCEGIYELNGGAVKRITNAPFDCGAQPCVSQELDPRVASDGSVAYVFQLYTSLMSSSGWQPVEGQSDLLTRDSSGNHQTRWPTACDGTSSSGSAITDADRLAVNPLIPSQIAYANCGGAPRYDGACGGLAWTDTYDVIGSGASQATAGDDIIYHSVKDPNAECFDGAQTRIADIDFSPDASRIVEIHSGASGDAGIWTYAATNNGGASATELMAIPNGWIFYSARYIGSGRIAFTAGPSSDKISLYSMPATCTPAQCNVVTGAGVTNLTGSQFVSSDYVLNTAGFSYTSSGATIPAVGTPPPPPPCTGTGCKPPPPPPPPPCKTCKPAVKLTATLSRITTQRMSTLLRKGLSVKVTCSAACWLSASLKLKRTVLGTASKGLTKRGTASFTVRLSHTGARALKRAHRPTLTLSVVGTDGAGKKTTVTRTFKTR